MNNVKTLTEKSGIVKPYMCTLYMYIGESHPSIFFDLWNYTANDINCAMSLSELLVKDR